ncbi:IS66 family transposase [Mediterraneibacter glycyrrhizinilyticus]|uniref:IS66 family transposase n=1 Tax=Mediterraneibacter glycyrrhizinilyticus TaxID=342942 RepID=UPI0025A4AF07|nr:IS66 family transposase [Mediterraneibacter glycyrrhizinilyticus]MDM8126824.1 IS66 family transposase [Mediterraneibacter glycyrrhizinilyticus]
MDPIFTEEQLNRMSRDDMLSLVKIMQGHYQKQKESLEKQETRIQLLEEKTKELEFLNAMLSDRLTLAQRKRFGASSEKYADGYAQLNLFNEAEQEADPNAPEPDLEEVHPSSYKRKKRSGKKEEDLSSFETTEVIEYKLTGRDRYCPDCNTKYKVVTKETVKRLKFILARFEVVEEVTFVYSCPKCGTMKRPEKEPSLLKGSVATPSLVAGIMNAKYVNGMPLARQEREFARYDLNLSTKTMANWIIQCADRYLQPLYNLMKEELLQSKYLHGDETRIQVIDEPDQKGSTQNWMWVYLTDEYSDSPRMVLFQYERTRAGYHPAELLGDQFEGYFTCDGYQAYHSLPGRITVTGCMAHARRRFDEALTVLKKDFTKEQLKETTTYQAMERIGMLYKIEEMIRDKSPEERYEERQKQAKPLLEAFFEWLHTLEDSVDRSSLIGEAVLYTLNQEVYLKRYLENGHLSIDNLAAERALKNFAIGRRNWLFAKSIRGAQDSATVYSVTETAMLNGLKPYNYLTYVMERMKEFGPFPEKEAMRELLPWSNSLPADCHSKLKK